MNIRTFSSLKSKNYRLYFVGQSISLIGTWMQKTAVSWVIYSLTQSKFMLGVSVFATLFPKAIFSLFGGMMADRYNRYRILLATQGLSMIQALLMTIAIMFFKKDAVWALIILSAVLGVINAFDGPSRQALVKELVVDRDNLPNALALNSSMVNLSKLIGPALAGFILETFGEQVCFGSNALSFIAVIGSLLLIKLPKPEPIPKSGRNLGEEFMGVFYYIKKTDVLSSVMIFTALIGFFVLSFTTLTPVFAKDVFNGTATTLGYIDGFIGLGAFSGALFLASLKKSADLTRILVTNTFIFGVGLILFSFSGKIWLALLFLAIGAFGMMSVRTISNTVIQLNVQEEFRGRAISVYLMVLSAMIPLGSLLVSGVSHFIGVQKTVFAQGVIALVIAAFYARYLKKKKIDRADFSNKNKGLDEPVVQI